MPSPYSYDLRIRVVAAVEHGMGVTEAGRTFGLPPDTITGWLAGKEATGDVQAKVGYQRGHAQKITEPERFKTFVQTQGEATVEELAEAWGGVKRMTIWRQLRKLGYTHKKDLSLCGTRRQRARAVSHGGSGYPRGTDRVSR
jgi:transposase